MGYLQKKLSRTLVLCMLFVHNSANATNEKNTGALIGLISSVVIAITAGGYFYTYTQQKNDFEFFKHKKNPLSQEELKKTQELYDHLFDDTTLSTYRVFAYLHAFEQKSIQLLLDLYDIKTIPHTAPMLVEIHTQISLDQVLNDSKKITLLLQLTCDNNNKPQLQAMRLKTFSLRTLLDYAAKTYKKTPIPSLPGAY